MQSVVAVASLIKSGRLRALAVTSKQRLSDWPNLPTTSERFHDSDGTGWFGIFASSGTPPEIVAKLSRDIDAVIRMPDVIKQFEVAGIYPVFGGQKELAEKMANETPIFEKIVKDFNIKIK